jgi:hypothetical protein
LAEDFYERLRLWGGQSMAALTGMYPENCTGEH